MPINILSSSSILPQKALTNLELEKMVDTTDEWITQMTGIKERRILSESESFIDLTYQVAADAIKKAGLTPQDIGLIVLGTTTPEQVTPSSACILQGMLDIKQCIAFDLQAACSGFLFALANAYYFMQGNANIKYALVLGCDALSKITDFTDRATCILLADGFGGVVLGRDHDVKSKGIFYCNIGTTGNNKTDLEVAWGVAKGYDALATQKKHVYMNGKEVFKNAVATFARIINEALEKTNLTIDDIDWVIPHQANIRIINTVAEKIGCPPEKLIITLTTHGNTSAASIPMAYDAAVKLGKVKKGDKVLITSFGAGFAWGIALFEV